MPRRKNYIESPNHWKEMYTNHSYNGQWKVINKVPVDSIKIDKSLFDYPNEVNHSQVLDMIVNFDEELWIPILVNQNFYLLDGQHRLTVAKQLCLEYIDVVVETTDFREPTNKNIKASTI